MSVDGPALRRLKTVAELLPHFLTSRDDLRHTTMVNYHIWAARMAREWGDRAVRRVRGSQISGLVKSHNRHYAIYAQTFFRWLVRMRVLPNTFDCGSLPRRRRSDEHRVCYLSPGDARKFLDAVHPAYRAAFVLGLYAGLRPYECCRIEWSSINLRERRIKVEAVVCKIRRARMVESVPAALWRLLGQCPDRKGRVLPGRTDSAEHVCVARYIHERRRAAKAAGVTLGHDILRHTFATYHVALTGNAALASKLLGHYKLHTLAAHYDGVATRAQAREYFRPWTMAARSPWGRKPATGQHPKRA